MKKYFIIFLAYVLLFSCEKENNTCQNSIDNINLLPLSQIIKISDSISKERSDSWNEKIRLQKEKGIIIELFYNNNVLFDKNCFVPKINIESIYNVIGIMLKNKKINIEILGHSDNTESERKSNISFKRAEFVKNMIIKCGIDENRLEIIDKKETFPIEDNSTKAGRLRNRRVEFKVKD